jgi:hypothetical protein
MAFELLGAFFVALTLGLFVWALRKRWPGIPRWMTPASAGLGLIVTAVYMEYSWYTRVSGALPEGFIIANANSDATPLRPWTFLVPMVTRFEALDGTKVARHPNRDDLIVAPVFGFARWQNPQNSLIVFDCVGKRRVPVTEGMAFTDAGELTGAEWIVLEEADDLQEAACREG